MMSAFQATIGGGFAPLATLVDEDADLDSMVPQFNKAVTETAADLRRGIPVLRLRSLIFVTKVETCRKR